MMAELGSSGRTYTIHVVSTLWDSLPQVLWGALLFNLLCVPAFLLFSIGLLAPALLVATATVGPAWAALQAYEMQMLEGVMAHTTTFFYTLRNCFGRSLLLSLLGEFPLLVLLATLPMLQMNPVPQLVWLGFGADFLGCAIMASLLLYAFPLLIKRDGTVRTALRDAFILAGRYPSNTLGLLGMAILFGFGIIYLSLGLLLILPTIYGLFVVANCRLVMQEEGIKLSK